MKQIAGKCCGSCKEFTVSDEEYQLGMCGMKNQTFQQDWNEIKASDYICEGDNYNPRSPIDNYEDELLKALIEDTKHQIAMAIKGDDTWWVCQHNIKIIEKAMGQPWEDIINENNR